MTLHELITCFGAVSTLWPWLCGLAATVGFLVGIYVGERL